MIRDRKIEIDEEQAEVVREIFSSYLSGMNMREIANHLNDAGIPVKSGKEECRWRYTAISYILSNEKYIGDSLWQKTYSTDTFPVQRFKNNGEREQYYAAGTHPPIIDLATFQAVQELKAVREEMLRHRIRKANPLNQKICCGACGTLFRKRAPEESHTGNARNHNRGKDNCPVTQIPRTGRSTPRSCGSTTS